MKKTLKFKERLVPLIMSGEKDVTWRIFDDKDLQVGDELDFINKQTMEKFGEAKILNIQEKTLGEISIEEAGHHNYESIEQMYETYRKYYGDKVGPDTPLKIIKFEFKSTTVV